MKNINLDQIKNKKTAFVCSGGVVKAASWHLGVAMALEELGFSFKSNKENTQSSDLTIDTYVGSSAGALISLYLASGFKPQQIIRAQLGLEGANLRAVTYKDMLSLRSPIKKPPMVSDPMTFEFLPKFVQKILNPLSNISGFFTTYGLSEYLKDNVLISNNFDDYKSDIFLVATQLDHSRKVIFGKYHFPNPRHDQTAEYYTGIPISEAAAASMSVPPFYSPYPVKNPHTSQVDYYIDGEIRETLSSHIAVDNGCENIICSWTHTPYHFQDEIGSLVSHGLPAICVQSIFLMIQKKIISGRANYKAGKDLVDSVHKYMTEEKFNNKHKKKILKLIEQKLGLNLNTNYIDIYPTHHNEKLFFASNFSLGTDATSAIVKMGYRRTLKVFESLT